MGKLAKAGRVLVTFNVGELFTSCKTARDEPISRVESSGKT